MDGGATRCRALPGEVDRVPSDVEVVDVVEEAWTEAAVVVGVAVDMEAGISSVT